MRMWALIVGSTLAVAHAQGRESVTSLSPGCADEAKTAGMHVNALNDPVRGNVLMHVDGAYARFRFHRVADAQRLVKSAVETLNGPPATALPAQGRTRALRSVQRLEACMTTAVPPPFASLTVRAVYPNGNGSGQGSKSAGAGVFVRVEDITIGRTGADGTLTARVPSGEIRVEMWTPPSFLAQDAVSLEPGATRTLTLTMGEGKQMVELADLRVQAMRGSDPPTLMLTFVTNDGDATITKVVMAVALNREGEVAPPFKIDRGLDSYFTVHGGRIRTPLPAVAADLQKQGVAAIRVTANDAAGFTYSGTVDLPIR